MNKTKIKQISISAVFTAIIAACAWISIPTPFGINLAFSLFGVCLTAFYLDIKNALFSTVAYLALGAVGLPVFSHFSAGLGILFGLSGGFLWGFLFTCIFCAIAKKTKSKTTKYFLMVFSVLICHIFGTVQYSIVTGNRLIVSFLSASLPFLIKDIFLVFVAEFVAKKIKI